MEKLKSYKTQIFNLITIFLIIEFVIYPGLTTANTLMNIAAGVGLLLLVLWGGIALYQYATSNEGGLVDMDELREAEKMVAKPKAKRKPKATKSEYPLPPHHTTIKKSKTTKTK